MVDRIKLRRTTTAGKIPNTSEIQSGELALNLTDKKLYSSDGTTIFEIGDSTYQKKYSVTKQVLTNGSYTHFANILGTNFASSCFFFLSGTSDNTVVCVQGKIIANHPDDLICESVSGAYSQVEIRVTSDINANVSIQVKSINLFNSTNITLTLIPFGNTVDFTLGATYGNILLHETVAGGFKITNATPNTQLFIENNKIWHEGNDGADSGLDADRLDSYDASISSAVNTVVVRNHQAEILAARVVTIGGNPSFTNNVAIGTGTLLNASTGGANVAVGTSALAANTSQSNTAIGSNSFGSNTTGQFNVGVGALSGLTNTTGQQNVYIGAQSGYGWTTGSYNVFIGRDTGMTFSNDGTGSNNVLIGSSAQLSANNASSEIVIAGTRFRVPGVGIDWTSGTTVWTSANDGPASGLHADLVDDYHADINNTLGNTIVVRNANRAIEVSYIDSRGNTPNDASNLSLGKDALINNTGSHNIGVGNSALNVNTSGYADVAVGSGALRNNSTGYHNIAIGLNAGFLGTTGYKNIYIGTNAGFYNLTGDDNVFVGDYAGFNQTNINNVFVGASAGYGGSTNSQVINSVCVGYQAGVNSSTAGNNVFVGYRSGYSNTTGGTNTFVGLESGYNTSTGQNNTLLGSQAGYSITTGSNNIIIGNNTGDTNDTDVIRIGNISNNRFIISGLGIDWTNSTTVWTNLNDGADSGLNADKLDDLHSSSFIQTSTDQTASGLKTFTTGIAFLNGSGTPAIYYKPSGFSSGYGYTVIGNSNTATGGIALGIDPSTIAGNQFLGANQVLIGNNAILAPNTTQTDWSAVIQGINNQVRIGGATSGGQLLGNGLVIDNASLNVTINGSTVWHGGNDSALAKRDGTNLYTVNTASSGTFQKFVGASTDPTNFYLDFVKTETGLGSGYPTYDYTWYQKQYGGYTGNVLTFKHNGGLLSNVATTIAVNSRTVSLGGESLQLVTTDNTPPSLSFHRAGYSAIILYELNNQLYILSNGQSSNKIWHEGNDGSGSGLDADSVDGVHASQFVRTDENSNLATASISFGTTARQMLNLWSTNYGVGVQSATLYFRSDTNFAFHIGGSHDNNVMTAGSGGVTPFYINSTKGQFTGDTYLELGANSSYSASLRIGGNGYTAGQNNSIASIVTTDGSLILDSGGNKATYINCLSGTLGTYFGSGNNSSVAHISNTGVYTQLSDFKAKENITPTGYGLAEILKLNPVEYNWKTDSSKKKEIGLIAQEVQEIIPEVVSPINKDNDILGLDYAKLIPVLINSIKELKQEIEELKSKCLLN